MKVRHIRSATLVGVSERTPERGAPAPGGPGPHRACARALRGRDGGPRPRLPRGGGLIFLVFVAGWFVLRSYQRRTAEREPQRTTLRVMPSPTVSTAVRKPRVGQGDRGEARERLGVGLALAGGRGRPARPRRRCRPRSARPGARAARRARGTRRSRSCRRRCSRGRRRRRPGRGGSPPRGPGGPRTRSASPASARKRLGAVGAGGVGLQRVDAPPGRQPTRHPRRRGAHEGAHLQHRPPAGRAHQHLQQPPRGRGGSSSSRWARPPSPGRGRRARAGSPRGRRCRRRGRRSMVSRSRATRRPYRRPRLARPVSAQAPSTQEHAAHGHQARPERGPAQALELGGPRRPRGCGSRG